jgi:hypothetical protein
MVHFEGTRYAGLEEAGECRFEIGGDDADFDYAAEGEGWKGWGGHGFSLNGEWEMVCLRRDGDWNGRVGWL